mgnify:FL=1
MKDLLLHSIDEQKEEHKKELQEKIDNAEIFEFT